MATVDVVIPVYNEERVLAQSVAQLRDFLKENLPHPCTIVIADNGSVDGTLDVAKGLAKQYREVTYIHLDQKGRGRALRRAWLESQADIVSYMDVDLSTNLAAFPPLVAAIIEGYDIAIGSRLMKGAQVQRSLKREFISRSYNLLVKVMFSSSVSDAQCGFKALSHQAAQALVPLVKDQAWFFDSELLILAEKKGYRIKEIPVEWVEDADTRVRVVKTAWEDVKGLCRLRVHPPSE
ncbi:MAG: glycosyltransferase family 2 protein [Chloroflexi bacterium]|nr:glycosyltransferase family 2 protein [Chloroflexota bacterium]